jgi:hypothetical protein
VQVPPCQLHEYLRDFVDFGRFNSRGAWTLDSLEFGRHTHAGLIRPFELIFDLDQDTYGGWGVLLPMLVSQSATAPSNFVGSSDRLRRGSPRG